MRRFAVALVCVLLPLYASAAIPAFKTANVVVGTTATALRTSLGIGSARQVLACVPDTESATVWMGDTTVTVGNGIPVPPGKCYATGTHLADGVALYAVVSSGTANVRVQENY